jgi:hypothetical protein
VTQRDNLEIEALVADRYLDSLLAARDRRAADAPADATLDPDVRHTARLLEAELGRVHPSFRFEERLANELQARASRSRGRVGRFARASGRRRPDASAPIQLRPQQALAGVAAPDTRDRPADGEESRHAPIPGGRHLPARFDPAAGRRPLIIGGALTSAALSIAGAYVAWRRGRPPANPMVRAVRAAHRSGLTRGVARRRPRLALPGAGRGAG